MSPIPPITGTGIAATAGGVWSPEVVYQLINGYLSRTGSKPELWNTAPLNIKPVDGTPLAVISWGNQLRVYYLNSDYVIQELGYIEGKDIFIGDIGKLNVKAVPGSGLAVIVHGLEARAEGEGEPNDPGLTIRVYYQESGSNLVRELAYNNSWKHGDLRVPDALGGTYLAAVTYYFERQIQIRVYYQAIGLNLREYAQSGSGWFQGGFNPGKATNQTPLTALVFGAVQLQVYWRDLRGHVFFQRNTGVWDPIKTIEPIGPGYKFAAIQLANGKNLRLYYQKFDGSLVEYVSNDSGKTWSESNLGVVGPE
jgi:hypothetical protein